MSRDENPYGPSFSPWGGGSGGSPPPRRGPPPARGGGGAIGVLAIVATAVGVLFLVCCGACCGLFQWSNGAKSQEVAVQIRDQPAIRQHLGELESCTYNFTETIRYPDQEVEVYDLVGALGSAELVAGVEDGPLVTWAKLVLPDGSEHTVLGDPPAHLEHN